MNVFSETEEVRAIQGDTLPAFHITPTGYSGNLSSYSMRFVLSNAAEPDEAVLTKACTYSSENQRFDVQLVSSETEALRGMYMMFFITTDSGGNEFIRLVGQLTILPKPKEVT